MGSKFLPTTEDQAANWFGIRVERPYCDDLQKSAEIAAFHLKGLAEVIEVITFRTRNERAGRGNNVWPTTQGFYLRWSHRIVLLDRLLLADHGMGTAAEAVKYLMGLIEASGVCHETIPVDVRDTFDLSIPEALDEILSYPVLRIAGPGIERKKKRGVGLPARAPRR
ncbi:MAG: hypothetical protein KGK00_14680 [Paracoccaceae bacterium]|nr:hypothetical protein [Paracoccaceae bacterium]